MDIVRVRALGDLDQRIELVVVVPVAFACGTTLGNVEVSIISLGDTRESATIIELDVDARQG